MQVDLIHRVVSIASRRDGRISHEQLRAAGASEDWIRRQCCAGWLIRTRRGHYRVGPPHLVTRRGSAVDAGGSDAMMLGLHGLHAWGLTKRIDDGEPIVVWAPTHRRHGDDTRYSRAAWVSPADGRTLGSLRIASRAACIASSAAHFEPVDIVALIKEACFWEPSVARQLHELPDRNGRSFRGADRVRIALDWYEHGHCGLDSKTEKWVLGFLRSIGAPMPVVNAWVELSDEPMRVDLYFDDAGLVLEVNPVGHKRDWVRINDLGRIARIERDQLRAVSLDMTRPRREREQVLRHVANLARTQRIGPYVPIVLPPDRE